MTKNLSQQIKTIPHSPGCYKYFNQKGELIYIGKAKDLKKRVTSYFVGSNDPKTTVLVENINDIRWEVTESEIEALVLESLLIKKFKPKFNIKIKDDKDFLWVKIDMSQEYPYPELVRRTSVGAGSPRPKEVKFFGPFTDPKLLKEGLAVLRKIFLWRDCSSSKFSFYNKKSKPCLEYYIKNCSAPCTNSINANDYRLGVKQLILFLQGGKKRLINDFERQMKKFSKNKEFEKAAVYRDKLRSLKNIDANLKINKIEEQEKTKDLEKFVDHINLDLGYELEPKDGFRIEFYDISNISGKEAVGSMIVWRGNSFAKSKYRKFKIKYVTGINDYKMMEEVLARRIKRTDWGFPDLFVMDGGKGQLGTIQRLFWQNNIKTPIVSLAKREEEIFGVADGRFKKTSISKNSPEGFFIQRLRDEAHRFAIGYHKVLRSKKTFSSQLDNIEGIGPVMKKKLLLKFGSVSGIIKADFDEVKEVVGEKVARRIKERL
ncbi:MAG: excinuclease ABC subunit UvrC [Patescibacteria group bacterium]|nr:excinuclease ABC subunit UvrC [Patescibacteria group bacterium]